MLVNQPDQPRNLRSLTAASIALFSLVSADPPLPSVLISGSSDIVQQRVVQYQSLAFLPEILAAPEAPVPIDTWETPSPVPPRYHRIRPSDISFTLGIAGIDSWGIDLPVIRQRLIRDHAQPAWSLPEIPVPPEPEPPEPEPEVRRFKSMHVRVRHNQRPPGGFNTIFYMDDDEQK